MKPALVILMLALFLFPSRVLAQYVQSGVGHTTCREWLKARHVNKTPRLQVTEAMMTSWAQGYFIAKMEASVKNEIPSTIVLQAMLDIGCGSKGNEDMIFWVIVSVVWDRWAEG